MNTAARSVNQGVVTPKRLVQFIVSRSQWTFFVLLMALIASAISVIYMTNESRQLNSQLQEAQAIQQQLNTQWGQLLLEKSSWQSQSRVAEIAANSLQMVAPKNKHYILVNS